MPEGEVEDVAFFTHGSRARSPEPNLSDAQYPPQDLLCITSEDMATTMKVLSFLADNETYYRSAALRDVRRALIPLFEYQHKGMFLGMQKEEYKQLQVKKIRKAHIQNQQKQQDKLFVQKTQLRAGRIQKLEKLAQQDGAKVHGHAIQFLLDGVADDGTYINSTTLSMIDCPRQAATIAASTDKDSFVQDGDRDDSAETRAPPLPLPLPLPPPLPLPENAPQNEDQEQELNGMKQCYICKRRFRKLHHFYDSLCPSCASLNWEKRLQTCDMTGRVCLVTGGRVKIGFQCCLKLLR